MKTPYHPNTLLDTVLADQGLRNDAHLADRLDVSRATVSKVRKGERRASAEFKLALVRTFKMSLKKIEELDATAPPAKEKA